MQRFVHSRQRLNQFENVQAGSQAVVNLPIGPTYLDLDLKFAGVTLAQINEIRVKINNEIRHRYSATELNFMNRRVGMPDAATTGQLKIAFVRFGLKTLQQEVSTALVTGVADAAGRIITSLVVEIDIDSAASAPAFDLFCNVSDPIEGGPGYILSIFRDTFEAAVTGEKTISNLYTPGDPKRLLLNRHFMFLDETKLDRFRVLRNNFEIWDHTPASSTIEEGTFGKNGFSNVVVIDPTIRNYGGNGFELARATDYRLLLNLNASVSQVTILSEFVGLLR